MTRVSTILICFVQYALIAEAVGAWNPAQTGLMTRWGKEVTPENAWRQYPRPQLARTQWLNLNGLWDYALQPRTASMPPQYDKKILVPFCVESALSGVGGKVTPQDRIWYRKDFEIPSEWADQRILLHFEAVDWETAVWLNGAYIGSHKGGYDRFSFDVTDYVSGRQRQELVVSVWDPTNEGRQPRGKQQIEPEGIWYTPVSGIWQTVWLEPVSKIAAVGQIRIVPDVDHGSVSLLALSLAPAPEACTVRWYVQDGENQIAQQQSDLDKETVVTLNPLKTWSPESPFLYDLKIELIDAEGKTVDQVSSYFGMRKISLGNGPVGKVLHLNNTFLFHNGTLDQGWWPDGLHTPPSDAAMQFELMTLKQMGFNMARKHIKVEPDRWYYWCDKLGIMVWQDMPSAMASFPQQATRRPRRSEAIGKEAPDLNRQGEDAAQFEYELTRMIALRFNAPSIVMWVPFNEGWGQYDTARITRLVQEQDRTRLVNSASGWSLRPGGDIYDIHTYGQQLEVPPMQADRATVIGEYGGIGLPVEGHLWNPGMRNWGYQTYKSADELYQNYVHKFEQIVEMKSKGLSAAVYTQTTDVEGEVNGLLTYDREVVKIPADKLKTLHEAVYQTSMK
ncbi:MAG: hypothetical protein LLF76_13140 [Planctomycetaceae bacterium]|nr:hypothetical protein [Planctomycetaceae bacterium]